MISFFLFFFIATPAFSASELDTLKTARQRVEECDVMLRDWRNTSHEYDGKPGEAGEKYCADASNLVIGATRTFPKSEEAAVLYVELMNVVRDVRALEWVYAQSKVNCRRASSYYQKKFQKDGAKDENFEVRCGNDAERAYASKVSGEKSMVAKFVEVQEGDYSRYIFKDANGKIFSFVNTGAFPESLMETPSKYKGKKFKITWVVKKAFSEGAGESVDILTPLKVSAIP